MKSMKINAKYNKLIIIGASGHGKVAADIAVKMNLWQKIAFADDDDTIISSLGIFVEGQTSDVFTHLNESDIFVAIGNNKTRERILCRLEKAGASITTLIHPGAIIGGEVELGAGTIVMAGTVINCCSNIGSGCIINTGATIDHDNKIEDYVHISPGAHLAGTVKIGKNTWLGIGSIVSNNLCITGGCTIGAGAVVVRNITEPGIYVGVPAHRIYDKKKLYNCIE